MKTKKPNHYKEILELLKELKFSYPTSTLGQHISTAFEEYGDVWGTSDKELLFALVKYKAQMELTDVPRETLITDIDAIIEDGMHLSLNTDYEGQEY